MNKYTVSGANWSTIVEGNEELAGKDEYWTDIASRGIDKACDENEESLLFGLIMSICPEGESDDHPETRWTLTSTIFEYREEWQGANLLKKAAKKLTDE